MNRHTKVASWTSAELRKRCKHNREKNSAKILWRCDDRRATFCQTAWRGMVRFGVISSRQSTLLKSIFPHDWWCFHLFVADQAYLLFRRVHFVVANPGGSKLQYQIVRVSSDRRGKNTKSCLSKREYEVHAINFAVFARLTLQHPMSR